MRLFRKRHSADDPWTYHLLDHFQRRCRDEVLAGGQGVVILSELAPVITIGRRTPPTDVFSAEVETYPTDRGGLATYHGPGQWVLFVVERLERLTGDRRGVRKAVHGLLELATQTAKEFETTATVEDGKRMGVWVDGRKLASVGVYVDRGVLLHGLAMNVFPTPLSFSGLRPCGLDCQPAFLHPDDTRFEAVGDAMLQSLGTAFQPAISFSAPRVDPEGSQAILPLES